MLVLSRKPEEGVTLTLTEPLPAGTVLNVLLVRLQGERARLGIEAPKSVSIQRDELIDGGTTPPESAALPAA